MQQSIDNNPFQTGSKEAHYWQEGWWDAFYEIAPRFTEQSNYLAANDGWINKLSKYKWPLVGSILSASLVATSWVIFEAAA